MNRRDNSGDAMSGFATLVTPITRIFLVEYDEQLMTVWQYSHGDRIPEQPLQLRWCGGRGIPGDAVWPDISSLVASPRLLDALAPFSGWFPYPVELRNRKGELLPGYAGVAVTGRCGRLCYDNSRVEGEWPRADYVGLRFNPAMWDGSDLFYGSTGSWLVVTERVVRALRRARVSSIDIEPLLDHRARTGSADAQPDVLCYPPRR